ncbi:uncharacterized protein LOC142220117 [Haematobia irritans]|uniref:uncharacterized protein LOC142220117 n=1 Tax=Haematobia irritans TaxID=7368 RepID=UPI003F50613A
MLVATPGQTTVYTLHNNGNAPQTSSTAVPATSTPSLSSVSTSSNSTKPNNFTFHSTTNHKNIKSSNDTDQHSQKNADNSKTSNSSFISTLKDNVQKALVTTASTFSRNCQQATTTSNKSNCSTSSNNYNTSKSIFSSQNTSSSSSSLATSKFSSTSMVNNSSSSSMTSAILPLSIVRKKSQSLGVPPKLHTVPPTTLHRDAEERQKNSSTDSLQKEMCHFKPIRTVPTTPSKSGSKSRGSSLRFPKANLATKKIEFILKSNCDVNNRKRKDPPSRLERKEFEADNRDKNANDEQENKEYYERYKPKPSTLHLFTHSDHQSAFVCLVAHMKSLINIQSVKMLTSASKGTVGNMDLQRIKGSRNARAKEDVIETANYSNSRKTTNNRTAEIFVRPSKLKSPTVGNQKLDLIGCSRYGGIKSTQETNEMASKKISKINESSSKVSKAKSRAKLKCAKSSNLHMSAKAKKDDGQELEITGKCCNVRKRKNTSETSSMAATEKTSSPKPRTTKKRRLSNNVSDAGKNKESTLNRKKPSAGHFSPPVTRSRLKQIMQEKAKEILQPPPDMRKRKF